MESNARLAYQRWYGMVARCTDPSHPAWKHYGGRGITVCDEWRTSFHAFYAFIGDPPFDGASLDRFPDNDGPYAPGNVRWATRAQQSQNRRRPDMRNHWASAKTHCPRDHPYDEANTYYDKRGYRSCKACNRLAQARYQARKAAA